MIDPFSVGISLISLVMSTTTLWLTLLRRGRLVMTVPTLVFFGFDTVPRLTAKVFLRTLLYSTSERGQVIEGMYVRLGLGDSEQLFSFWGYGETNKLVPGSGLFVGRTGVAVNHHFVLPPNGGLYEFMAGDYCLRVFARIAGRAKAVELARIKLRVTQEQAKKLKRRDGILFERSPDTEGYTGHAEEQ